MAAGDTSKILRVPGTIVVDPTDLSIAYPYGGTPVGRSRLFVLRQAGEHLRVQNELLGETSEVLTETNRWVASFFLRGFDADALQRLFAGQGRIGSVSGHAVFEVPGTSVPGTSQLGTARKVLLVPDDVVSMPAALIYRGVAHWAEGAELLFQRQEELGLPTLIECVRDSRGKMLAIGRLADLSL